MDLEERGSVAVDGSRREGFGGGRWISKRGARWRSMDLEERGSVAVDLTPLTPPLSF
jgi:hypothetical protein